MDWPLLLQAGGMLSKKSLEKVSARTVSSVTCKQCSAVQCGQPTAKWRRVLVVHGGTWEASGRSTREPRERLMRQGIQLDMALWSKVKGRLRQLESSFECEYVGTSAFVRQASGQI